MKRSLTLSILLVCLILTTADCYAGGPWEKVIRGSGRLNFTNLNGDKLTNAHLTWNFKMNSDGVYNGHLNIVEKLDDGTMNRFQLFGDQVETFGDEITPKSSFNCSDEDPSVLIAGRDSKGMVIIASFDPPNNIVFYDVFDHTQADPLISSTGHESAAVQFEGHMLLDCGEESQITQQGRTADSSKIFLPIVLSDSGN